jgi:hypothetical protein
MADQKFDRNNGNPAVGSMRLVSQSTDNARVHRLYTETHTLSTSDGRPRHPTTAITLLGFTIGQVHPKNAYAYLIGAEIVEESDTHETWQTIWQTDMKAYATAAGLSYPNLLARDGYAISDQWGSGSSDITWTFDVVNPESYVTPTPGTVHPLVPTAVLVGHTMNRSGVKGRVVRRYKKLARLIDYSFDPETNDEVTTVREITASVIHTKPPPGMALSHSALGTTFYMRTTRAIKATVSGSGKVTPGIPSAYTRRPIFTYTFPRLLMEVRTVLRAGGDVGFWNIYREGFTKRVTARVEVDFHRTMPPALTLFQPKPNTFYYPGATFNFSVGGALNDATTIRKVSGGVEEILVVPASEVSRSAYMAMVSSGQEALVAAPVTEWRFGLFRRERVYIRLE